MRWAVLAGCIIFLLLDFKVVVSDNYRPKVKEMTNIERQIVEHEGFVSTAFRGPEGALLIGYGRNLESKGMTKGEARTLLINDIRDCESDLFKIFGDSFESMSLDRHNALIDMRYTLGATGFRTFNKMIKAVKNKNYPLAAKEIKNSLWYTQVGSRGDDIYKQMRGSD